MKSPKISEDEPFLVVPEWMYNLFDKPNSLDVAPELLPIQTFWSVFDVPDGPLPFPKHILLFPV